MPEWGININVRPFCPAWQEACQSRLPVGERLTTPANTCPASKETLVLTVEGASLSCSAAGKRLLASYPTHTRIFHPIHFAQVVYIAPLVRKKTLAQEERLYVLKKKTKKKTIFLFINLNLEESKSSGMFDHWQ